MTVVVAVNADRRVYRLLRSLLDQTQPRHTYEVIVVENGSSVLADVGALDAGVVRYLHSPEPNAAAARNMGLRAARGRYLLLTDADCVARPDWVERMSRHLADGTLAAVGGAIVKYEPKTLTQRFGITVANGQTELNYLPALPLPYVVGANSGFVTATLRQVGGFDEAFRSGNDVDICYQLGLSGYRIGLAPDGVVMHEDRASAKEHFHRFKNYAIYQVLLHAKYRDITGRRFILNPYPFNRVCSAVWSAPAALMQMLRGDTGPASELFLKLIEAAGVWYGDIIGSVRYRQLYL
ncbi:MAG: glycosyltransferase family 2 protein [Pseudonocardiaceae bacterium]